MQSKEMRSEYHEWLENRYRPIAGRESGSGAGTGTVEGEETAGEGEGEGGSGEGEGGEGEGEEQTDTQLAYSKLLDDYKKKEEALKAAEAAVIRERAEAKKARDALAEKGGDWENVAKQRKAELDDATDRALKAEAERAETSAKLDAFEKRVRVTSIAARLNFRDPTDAAVMISPEDMSDDVSAERALRQLAEKKSYLVDNRRATGRETTGSGRNGQGGLTMEQVQAMSTDEVNARWAEVQEFMKKPNPGG